MSESDKIKDEQKGISAMMNGKTIQIMPIQKEWTGAETDEGDEGDEINDPEFYSVADTQWLTDIADRGEGFTIDELMDWIADADRKVSASIIPTTTSSGEQVYIVLPNIEKIPLPLVQAVAEELNKAKKDGCFQEKTLSNVFQEGFATTGQPKKNSQFKKIIETSIEKQYGCTRIPTIRGNIAILWPVDTLNTNIWGSRETIPMDAENQLEFKFDVTKREKKRPQKKAEIKACLFGYGNSPVELTEYDKFICIIVAALYLAKYKIVTTTQICRTGKISNNPSSNQIQKVWESLTKLGAVRISINNTQEINAGYNYPIALIDDVPLLSFKRTTAMMATGEMVDAAITIQEEPPLIAFARMRNQVESISVDALSFPLNKTEDALSLFDSLLCQTARINRGYRKSKMLWDTVLKPVIETNCLEDKEEDARKKALSVTKNKKSRAKGNAKKILDHMKKSGLIEDYVEADDKKSITITKKKKSDK